MLSILFIIPSLVKAQEDAKLNVLTAKVTNNSGDLLMNVLVYSSKSKNRALTDSKGLFNIESKDEDELIVSLLGYEKRVVVVHNGQVEDIILNQWSEIDPKKSIKVSFGSLPFERITGSVESITGDELSNSPTNSVQEALAGRLSGLTSTYGSGATIDESFGNSIRQGGIGQTYVDGIPSTLFLTPGEVKEVIVAKDYGSSFLYGVAGSSGALIVNSKNGVPGEQSIKFKIRNGVRTPTFLPKTMNAQNYARNYNTALINDGLSPAFSQNAIDSYSNGSDPVRYPNNNYYDELVGNTATYSQVIGDFSGGNEKVQYFSHLDYYTTDGIESVGEGRKLSRLRMNNNVQIKFSDNGSVDIGIGGSFNKIKQPLINTNDVFATMYNYPANALPYKINDSIYAKSSQYNTNLLVDLVHGSISEDDRRDANARIGLNFDLSEFTKGLSFKGLIGLYTFNLLSKKLDPTVDIAEPILIKNLAGDDIVSYRNYSKGSSDTSWEKLDDRVDRSQFINATLNYDRNFGDNKQLIADVIYSTQKITGSTLGQDNINRNIGLRVNYFQNEKYVIEGGLMNSAIRQLSQKERGRLTYSAGLAWLAHKESFLANSTWLDFLKIRANFGEQGRSVDQYFLEDNLYKSSGAGTFGIQGSTSSAGGYIKSFTSSVGLKTPKQQYFNFGADFQLFKHKINGQLNYFNIRNYDQIVLPNNLYAILSSNSSYLPLINYEDDERGGIDGSITFNHNVGDFKFKFGVNAMYNTTYITKSNSVQYPGSEANRNVSGNHGNTILGLDAVGIFQNQVEIDAAAPQFFGEVKPGDIRYTDYNNDGVVDEKDIHKIANNSKIFYGINYLMQYKNVTFSIHGDGVLGGDYVENVNWNRGTNNYNVELANSWPVSNDLPRLTTLTNSNNYRNSSFWLKKAGYFNVRSVNLTYSLPKSLLRSLSIDDLSIFLAGKNLFVISSNNDSRYMPDRATGYSEHPILKAFEMGVQISF